MSSVNSKIIVIPDIHNRVYWIEDALSKLSYDKVIFLGDYFDNFNDSSSDIEMTAKWLKQSVQKSDRIHLYGTHDIWYRFPYNPYIMASGNLPEKERIINSIMDKEDWKSLKLFHFEQEFLFTHAGIHSYLINEYIYWHGVDVDVSNSHELIEKVIRPATSEAYDCADNGDSHPWLSAGISRGGTQVTGGITWLDWNCEFEPIPGLNQIVGHTEVKIPDKKSIKGSINYNLDTQSKYIGILENNNLVIQRM